MRKSKDYFITLIGLLLFGIGLYLIKAIAEPQNIMKTLPYLCIGLGCGMFGHGLGHVLVQKAAEKNPDLAKQIKNRHKRRTKCNDWEYGKSKRL